MHPGDVLLGRWRVLAPLGQGGMGRVDLVQDLRTGGRYALKTLSPGGDVEARLRFQREAEALARAEHPHVVRVHALEQDPGGNLHLLVEHLEGGDLAARLERAGPLSADEVRALGIALAAGLAHAHAAGVLHRDLKPHNVLLAADGTPKLADFGLARLTGARTLTATGAVMGTPETMAPEQARGDEVGPFTDVYGLGAVLYWMATGRPPHGAGTPLQLLARLGEPPLPPTRLRPGLPPDLEAAILRALAPDPAARWGSAAAFGAALAGEGRGPPRRPDPRRPVALLILGLLGAVGLGWTLTRLPGAPGAPGAPAAPGAVSSAPAAIEPPVDPVLERLAAEDGAGALAAVESRWQAGARDVGREAALGLLLDPLPDAGRRCWRDRRGSLSGAAGRALLDEVLDGLDGHPRGALGPYFEAERELERVLDLNDLLHHSHEAAREVPRRVGNLSGAADRAAQLIRAEAPRARARWWVFRFVPRLAITHEQAHLMGDARPWLDPLRRGAEGSPTGRAMELLPGWLAAAGVPSPEGNPAARLRPELETLPDGLGPPVGDLARVLARVSQLRALGAPRDPQAARQVLACWRGLRAALRAWKGPDLQEALRVPREQDVEALCRQLTEALRRAADAGLQLGWAEAPRPPLEAEEAIQAYGLAYQEEDLRLRHVGLQLLLGCPEQALTYLPVGQAETYRDRALVLLCRGEAALAVGDVGAALDRANEGEREARGAPSPLDLRPLACLRAVAHAASASALRTRGHLALAQADDARADEALETARGLSPLQELSWLPWRTHGASREAVLAIRAGRWRPGTGPRVPFPPRP